MGLLAREDTNVGAVLEMTTSSVLANSSLNSCQTLDIAVDAADVVAGAADDVAVKVAVDAVHIAKSSRLFLASDSRTPISSLTACWSLLPERRIWTRSKHLPSSFKAILENVQVGYVASDVALLSYHNSKTKF